MRIAVTARGPTPQSPVDGRFGRAYWVLIHDDSSGTWDAVDNADARNAVQGAGVRAAQALVAHRVDALLTGVTGPKAFRALEAAGVHVYHGAEGTVEAALQAWRDGQVTRAAASDAVGTP
ncbi:MAG: NifB/NifX family molybdenum-iron cluster-binding protein [Deltaproteobacteria bacterium]|nr:NifB/NifX family molybdenum-iron cluster-binding protein [Deltaproteobacteria bacterium]